jgi:peptidyl-prolyl cis-trans isomerase A (cyclophilin A)
VVTKLAIVASALVGLAACGDDGGSLDPGDAPPGDITTFDVTTSRGVFTLETHHSWAPHGVERFRELVDAGFYNDVRFFRVIRGFVAQFGINGTPQTDAMWSDRTIPDDPVVGSNKRGYITYAQTGDPNSRTTQLFVNLVDNTRLDAMGFAPFAMVTSGMDVVAGLNAEYGEAPDQASISAQGNTYLTTNFPRLDYIVSVAVH